MTIEGGTSWVIHDMIETTRDDMARDTGEFDSSDLGDGSTTEVLEISLDHILPDELLERIIAYLPIASIFRASSVCKRWYDIVSSRKFLWNLSNSLPHKPWYFMFTSSDEPIGYAYDPILRKWFGIDLPCIETSSWFIASSCGLVCFMDNDSQSELYICNPITKCYKNLQKPPGIKLSDYSALAISVNRVSQKYKISVVKSKQVSDDFLQWDLSIHLYDSVSTTWQTSATEVLTAWRGGDESVICDGVLYFLIYWTGFGLHDNSHCLISYNLSTPSNSSLTKNSIPVPFSLTCGRLMNLRETLVLVGGIGKLDRPGVIKGIGIWILEGREWKEITRMPYKFFQGFGEFDDVFASSGADDLIYIQSYGSPALLVFNMKMKNWKWAYKCPVTKKFPLQLFNGFCFEPRLEISP